MTRDDLTERDSPPGSSLRWPPPGLERMQGDLGQIAARGALAGGLLVLPLLFVVAREQHFATLGPLADAWWVALVLTTVGLAFAIDALVRTSRMLRRTSQALGHGYDVQTVWQVVADGGRDMGFLLQGARHFVVMDERERDAIVRIRVYAVTIHALAGLWLTVMLGLGLLAAARGWLSPTGLWVVTLLPAAAGYAFGGVGRVLNDSRVRRARRAYHNQPWSKDLASDEIDGWRASRAAFGSVGAANPRAKPMPGLGPNLGRAGYVTVALAFLVAIPVLTLLPASVAGPVLSTLATPRFDRVRQQAARAEGYRPYVVAVDPSVSPQEAGRLLHDLSHVGAGDVEPAPGERAPSTHVTLPWLPETAGENPMEVEPFEWGSSLLEVVADGTTGAQRAYLAQVASHPSTADFSRLASAGDLDAASARWITPFPADVTVATMPIPHYTAFRAGAQAHIGAAAYELTRGRADRAERLIDEVISVGFLLGDHGPTLIDNLVGFALVESGGSALEDLYEATGQRTALDRLRSLEGAAERAGARVPVGTALGTETWVRSLPDLVLDTAAVRGLRWEYLIGVTTLTPCLNMHRMVFGPDEEYERFLERAHASLVRFPSEEGLFELARGGWLGALRSDDVTLVGRILSVSMRRGESACGEIVRRLEPSRATF